MPASAERCSRRRLRVDWHRPPAAWQVVAHAPASTRAVVVPVVVAVAVAVVVAVVVPVGVAVAVAVGVAEAVAVGAAEAVGAGAAEAVGVGVAEAVGVAGKAQQVFSLSWSR